MSQFENTRKAIQTAFKAGWNNRTAIKFENIPFVQPKSADWVALFIQFGMARQITVGPQGITRVRGMITLQIFIPEDTGTKRAIDHFDFAKPFFHNVQLSQSGTDIQMEVPQIVTPSTQVKPLYQINLICPFNADEFT